MKILKNSDTGNFFSEMVDGKELKCLLMGKATVTSSASQLEMLSKLLISLKTSSECFMSRRIIKFIRTA